MNKTRVLGPFNNNPRYREFTKLGKFEILFYNNILLI